jgi:hypothetical protein
MKRGRLHIAAVDLPQRPVQHEGWRWRRCHSDDRYPKLFQFRRSVQRPELSPGDPAAEIGGDCDIRRCGDDAVCDRFLR